MTLLKTSYLKPVLIIALLMVMAFSVVGCEDLGFAPPPAPAEEEPEEIKPPTFIGSADRAIFAVYEHLLSQAESYEAKNYLADFSAISDNWSADSELLKDGTSFWYVVVDMTGDEEWEGKPYWQQAGWFVYQDGKISPSNRLQANALRIEADLQELSPPPEEHEATQ